MKVSVTKISDERWKKLMKLGEKTGCHQKVERSFSYHGYQFPVCARCTGVILGYLIAIPFFLLTGFHKKTSIGACLIMFADWCLQATQVKESTNRRRLLTGIAGGFGIMSIQLSILNKLFKRKKTTELEEEFPC
jgi:uncharacterized membrane protein